MESLEKKSDELLKEAKTNPNILGFIWCGARGKDEKFLTQYSDYDVCLVLKDDAPHELIKMLESYKSERFEVWPRTLTEFKNHAAWDSEKEWDRYNYAHNKAVLDKTGEIQKIIDEKGSLPKEFQRAVIEESLDNYINQVYRSAKYWRDGNEFAAYLDAVESLPPLMIALYALEERLRPYNKYFEWEFKNHLLKFLPWPPDEFITDYKHILLTGDIKTQKKIFTAVKKLFLEHGYSKSIKDWKDYYFVGE